MHGSTKLMTSSGVHPGLRDSGRGGGFGRHSKLASCRLVRAIIRIAGAQAKDTAAGEIVVRAARCKGIERSAGATYGVPEAEFRRYASAEVQRDLSRWPQGQCQDLRRWGTRP
jgi:hypothetical protein